MSLRLIPLLALLALAACNTPEPSAETAAHGAPVAAEYERGPHRGRMLRDGDFALEVTIFETGVPPEFRLYAYQGDQPVPPASVDAQIELTRLGGVIDKFSFRAEGDALVGSGVVTEPHSFDVRAVATVAGKKHEWSYASHEGRTTIEAAIAEASGTELPGTDPSDNVLFIIDDDICTRCALCVDRCPTGVIILGKVGTPDSNGNSHTRTNN